MFIYVYNFILDLLMDSFMIGKINGLIHYGYNFIGIATDV